MPTPRTETNANETAVLLSCCVAMLAVGSNGTAIMAAVPTMATELSLTRSSVQWAINAYLVVSGACIVMGGAAADRFGARNTALAGLALFAIASSLIAIAGNAHTLIAARALQGFAAAFAVPSTMAHVRNSAPLARQPAAIAAWTGFLMLGFSVGPLIGGTLTHFASWRVVFWLNVILMFAATVGLGLGGAPARRPPPGPDAPVDSLGLLLLAVFMVSLIFGLQELPHAALSSIEVVGPLALSLCAFLCLLSVELRARAPVFDVRFFGDLTFAMGTLSASLSMMSILSLLLYYNLYAQSTEGFGLTPLQAGASLLPLCVALLVVASAASRTAERFGSRTSITAGMGLLVLGSASVTAGTLAGGFVVLSIGLFIVGAGLALPYATAPQLALSALSQENTGQGSGMINACTFLGGSVGVAAGAIAYMWGGFTAVMVMLALVGLLGVVLGRCIPVRS